MPERGAADNLFKRGGVWYARIQIGKRDIRRSLRTSSKSEARKRIEKVLQDVEHYRFYGHQRYRWKDAVVAWAEEAAQVISRSTLRRYLVSIGQLRDVLDDLYLDEISAKTISQIARRRGVTNATRRRDLTAVSAVLTWSVAHGWRDGNPAKVWDRSILRERREPIVLPDEADIARVVAGAPPGLGRMIRFAQFTGMRQEEIASLTHQQVDERRRTVTLTKTKRGRIRSVPLDDRSYGALVGTPLRLGSAFVFWHGEDGDRYVNVASRFAALCKKYAHRRFRFHDLRHWYAVDYLRHGGSVYDLQKILGHSSIRTTEIYLDYLTPDEQARAKRGVL